MTFPSPSLQAKDEATTGLRRPGERWLLSLLRRSGSRPLPHPEVSAGDPLLDAGRRLRTMRESRGLSLRQLASETRISITVLEALEKGWRDRLPEPAYMRTMLALLEQHLELEPGCLVSALPPPEAARLAGGLQSHTERPPLGSLAFFATWQGTLLYSLLCLLLIYGLNRQQQRLMLQGLLPLHTVPAQLPPSQEPAARGQSERVRVLSAYPDLLPLERARQGQALPLLRRQAPVAPSAAASARPTASVDSADTPRAR